MKLINDLGMKYPTKRSKRKARFGIYECPKCSIHFETQTYAVTAGTSTQCSSCATTKHGMSRTRLYRTYNHMLERCSKPHLYPDYAKRKTKVYKEWKRSFEAFAEWALKNGYKDNLSIDRIDNDGNYEPFNCRWTTSEIQNRNTKLLRKSNTSGFRGVSWNKRRGHWITQICVENKRVYLGSSKTKKEAAIKYDKYVAKNNLEHTTNKEITI